MPRNVTAILWPLSSRQTASRDPLLSFRVNLQLRPPVRYGVPHGLAADYEHEEADRWHGDEPKESIRAGFDGVETVEIHAKVSTDERQWGEEDRH